MRKSFEVGPEMLVPENPRDVLIEGREKDSDSDSDTDNDSDADTDADANNDADADNDTDDDADSDSDTDTETDTDSNLNGGVDNHDSWNLSVIVSAGDFTGTDTAEVLTARAADGSLPDINFLHLVTDSDLVDVGIDVGLPFTGTAPDLGAFELSAK